MRELLAGSTTLVGSPVGFPSGGAMTRIKSKEAEALLDDGVEEMDVVANIGRLRSGQFAYVLKDLKTVVDVVSKRVPVKVILEVSYLDDDELHAGCDAVVESGADYIKTGTGWSGTPTTVETIRRILSFVGDAVAIKASGGIRTLGTVTEMVELGVSRFGINSDAAVRLIAAASDVPTNKGRVS
jgi:deoxyribose-phosphate aldolase